jgi:hypothetical protein
METKGIVAAFFFVGAEGVGAAGSLPCLESWNDPAQPQCFGWFPCTEGGQGCHPSGNRSAAALRAAVGQSRAFHRMEEDPDPRWEGNMIF